VAAGIAAIDAEAADHGRSIDRGHFGVLLPFVHGALPDRFADRLRRRQPDLDPAEVVASGTAGLADRLRAFVDAGATKFVVFPLDEPGDWHATINEVADECLPLQT
jgi:hypothetical protein